MPHLKRIQRAYRYVSRLPNCFGMHFLKYTKLVFLIYSTDGKFHICRYLTITDERVAFATTIERYRNRLLPFVRDLVNMCFTRSETFGHDCSQPSCGNSVVVFGKVGLENTSQA